MDILATLAVIAGIVFIGFISDLIFQKFSIPDVLILIVGYKPPCAFLINTIYYWCFPVLLLLLSALFRPAELTRE